jgi:hypothetical protein
LESEVSSCCFSVFALSHVRSEIGFLYLRKIQKRAYKRAANACQQLNDPCPEKVFVEKEAIVIRSIVSLFLLCTAAPMLMAQHEHTSSSNIVDGAVHPELIPDSAAYRLYFVAVSEMPNPLGEAQKRQLAHLGRIGLEDKDLQVLTEILNDFKAQYSELIAEYNASATIANRAGAQPDLAGFMDRRDALVQSVRDKLKEKLSAQGLLSLA